MVEEERFEWEEKAGCMCTALAHSSIRTSFLSRLWGSSSEHWRAFLYNLCSFLWQELLGGVERPHCMLRREAAFPCWLTVVLEKLAIIYSR